MHSLNRRPARISLHRSCVEHRPQLGERGGVSVVPRREGRERHVRVELSKLQAGPYELLRRPTPDGLEPARLRPSRQERRPL